MRKPGLAYGHYLKSRDWAVRRRMMLRTTRFRCELCSAAHTGRRPLEVHHRTYECVGDESREDLVVLCPTCHQRHHDFVVTQQPELFDGGEAA